MPLSDEGYLIENLFRIADKEGQDVPFLLNSAQRSLDESGHTRVLVPKARQEGVSSYVLARFAAACMKRRNVRAVVISHDAEGTQRLLRRVKYYLQHIRGPKPELDGLSTDRISFKKMDSTFYIGTAGSKKFGRGDTISHLHCSEYAFWPDPSTIMTGLMQAVPKTGEIFIESTGNGLNDYYNRCMRAAKGQSSFDLHFLPWHTFDEYQLEVSESEAKQIKENLLPELEEEEVAPHLTPGQLAWRRQKLDELNFDLKGFRQEYPMTLMECFQTTGESIFHKVDFVETDRWKKVDLHRWQLEGHPNPACTYTLGGDVAAGVGKDSSVCEIFCLETGEQVLEYVNNKIDPKDFAHEIHRIGEEFSFPYATVENNNHGILTLSELENIYPAAMLHVTPAAAAKDDEKRMFALGYTTSRRNKPLMIGRLRTQLATNLKIHSEVLRGELSTFVEHEDGKLAAAEGCHDDTVMASACAVTGINSAAMMAGSYRRESQLVIPVGSFAAASIIEELERRHSKFMQRPQVGEKWN